MLIKINGMELLEEKKEGIFRDALPDVINGVKEGDIKRELRWFKPLVNKLGNKVKGGEDGKDEGEKKSGYFFLTNKNERIKKEEKLEKTSDLVSFRLKNSSLIKNDKVEMMLVGMAERYKELYERLMNIDVSRVGVKLPRQSVYSFEMILGKEKLENYVTVLKEEKPYVKSALKSAWYKSPLVESEDVLDIFTSKSKQVRKDKEDEFMQGEGEYVGYEVKMKYNSLLGMVREDGRRKEVGLLRDLLESASSFKFGEEVFIQFSLSPTEMTWWKEAEEFKEGLEKKFGKNESMEKKLGNVVFDTNIRLLVKAESKDRCELICRSLMMVFRQVEDKNRWEFKRIKEKAMDVWQERDLWARRVRSSMSFGKRMLMSPGELVHFIKLPNGVLQREFDLGVGRMELKVPKVFRNKDKLSLGHVNVGGKSIEVGVPDSNLDDFMKSYCLIGSPRTGKDTAMINFIVEAAKRGHGAIIPDAINESGNDRGMADSIRDALPPDKIIDISFDDYDFPVYFGMDDVIEDMGENGINLMADNLLKILKLDDKYESKKLARLVAKACKCNLYDMYCFVRSREYQLEVLERLRVEDELLALQVQYEYIEKSISSNVEGAILSRLDEIMGNDLLKYMFAQKPNNNLQFKNWIEEGKVVIIRSTKSKIGELGTRVLMYLLVVKIFNMKKAMNLDDRHKDKTLFLVFNEFFQYMSEGLEETLSSMVVECPKYRLGMLFAFHSPTPNQISKDFWNTLCSSSLNYFLFKNTNERVYKDMENKLLPLGVLDAMKTERYESIFIPYVSGKQHEPFFMKMLPPPKMRQKMYDNSNLTEEHKREYGTNIEEVLEVIKKREMRMYGIEES